MPTELHDFDRQRIETDLAQLRELIERKQYLWETTTDPQKKEELALELAAHAEMIVTLKAYL